MPGMPLKGKQSRRFAARWIVLVFAGVQVARMAPAQTQEAGSPRPPLVLNVTRDRADGLYRTGEEAVLRIGLFDAEGRPVPGQPVRLSIARGLSVEDRTVTSGESPVEIRVTLGEPGFILCTASCEPAPGRPVQALCGMGFAPLEIRQSCPPPPDFDAFWARRKAELAQVPMRPRLDPLPPLPGLEGKVEAFDVRLACLGGAPVSGYFARPAGAAAGSLPAFLSLHGAGVHGAYRMDSRAAQGMLALDINAHGIENGKPEPYYQELAAGRLNGYPFIGADRQEQSYFLGMFLRVVRALEFLKAQPEWDGRTLIAFGSSQGGAQAIAAAGLDPQVSLCVALVPAMCEHLGFLAGRPSGWPGLVKFKDGVPLNPAAAVNTAYFDASSFAARMKAEAFFNVGFVDVACPPASVYAAYNAVPTPKEMENRPDMGHSYEAGRAEKRIADCLAEARTDASGRSISSGPGPKSVDAPGRPSAASVLPDVRP